MNTTRAEVYNLLALNEAAYTLAGSGSCCLPLTFSNPQTGATFTGHSLGAAIATQAYAEFGGRLVTFAGPRVGNQFFSKSLDGTLRVVNIHDVVPDVPRAFSFVHGGTAAVFDALGGITDLRLAHALTTYRAGLDQKPEGWFTVL